MLKQHKGSKPLTELEGLYQLFGPEESYRKERALERLDISSLNGRETGKLMNILMYLSAYPDSEELEKCVNEKMRELVEHIRSQPDADDYNYNSALPDSLLEGSFSRSLIQWLIREFSEWSIRIGSMDLKETELSEKLQLLLPEMIRPALYDKSWNWDRIRKQIKLDRDKELSFLLGSIDKLCKSEALRDWIFESFRVYIQIRLKGDYYLGSMRLRQSEKFYHDNLLKHFDVSALLNEALTPSAVGFGREEREAVSKLGKLVLMMHCRETDPITYARVEGVELHSLGRAYQIALYSPDPAHRQCLDSYVGYLLFKNGMPIAYGGSWMFGHRAKIGINVFPAYRGGESAYIFCQIMRVYRQLYGVKQFLVEPYQFGKGNPEGIDSGAYWFYYRLGYRSADPFLAEKAEEEWKKISADRKYRTEKTVLRSFCKSPLIRWNQERDSLVERLFFDPESLANRLDVSVNKTLEVRIDKLKASLENKERFSIDEETIWEKWRSWLMVLADRGELENLGEDKLRALLKTKADVTETGYIKLLQKQEYWMELWSSL